MFTPPSVNQISSAYLGNPQPLAQKVEKDKQQNGGIPQDLRQLLALNDITQGRNAAGIQQALQAPANMPTVAQSLQERARQAIQAQMMQQIQQQQAKEGQPITVPPNAPRPPMQAQGIDELQSNVGAEYAHGGIIGFDDGGRVQHFQSKGSVQDSDVKKEEEATSKGGDFFRSIIDAITGGIRQTADYGKLKSEQEAAVPGFFEALTPTQRLERERKAAGLSQQLSDVVEKGAATPFQAATDPGTIRKQLNAADVAVMSQPGTAPPPPAPPKSNANTQGQPRVNADNAPMPGGLTDLTKLPSVGVGQDYLRRSLAQNQQFDPEAYKQKFLKEVGTKDTSIYDQMAEELKARKERLNAPKQGYEALMDYLGDVSQAGGRNWFETGSRAAITNKAKQKERQSQQDLLVDKILDLGAKKKEAEYGERLGMFNLTKAEKDRINTESKDIAKSLGLSEDKAEELRQNRLLEEAKMKNAREVARLGRTDSLMDRAAAIRSENKGMSIEESIRRAALAGGAASIESTDVRKSKAYIDAKDKIDARFQHLISDTPYGKKQQELYNKAISDLDATFGAGGGGGIKSLASAAQPIPAGAKPSDLSVGTVYQTARGPAKWNGKAFDPV
jgi:hypothetical protein